MTTDEIMAALSAAEQSAPHEARAKLEARYRGLNDLAEVVRLTGKGGSRAELERRMTGARASAPRPAVARSTSTATRPVSSEVQRALAAHERFKQAAIQAAVNQRWLAEWHSPAAARERLTRLIEAFKDSFREEVRADLRYRLAVLDKTGRDPGATRPTAEDFAAARLVGMTAHEVAVWSRLAAAGVTL